MVVNFDRWRRCINVDVAKSDALTFGSGHHGVVPDLLWDDVKHWFDPEWNGSLPDVCVHETTKSDWHAVVDLVRSKGWAYEYSEDGRVLRVPNRVEAMFARAAEVNVILKVWPAPGLLAVFRPYAAEAILFDVDLREIQDQARLDALCSFLRAIGRRLGKPVLMSPEGLDVRPVLGYRVETGRVEVLPQP